MMCRCSFKMIKTYVVEYMLYHPVSAHRLDETNTQ